MRRMRYKKVLPNNAKTKKFLSYLPKIYLIGRWAKFGIREFPVTDLNEDGVPLVYDYYDGNGTCDNWYLVPITWTTTGEIWCWTTSRQKADEIVESMNGLTG